MSAEKVTSAAALLSGIEAGEASDIYKLGPEMEDLKRAAELVRDEAADRDRQIAGYRAMLLAVKAFLFSLRLDGAALKRKQHLVGMMAEIEDAGDRMDCAMLVQAAEVAALMAGKPTPKRGNVRQFPGRK